MLSNLTAVTTPAAPPARNPTPAAATESRDATPTFARLLDQAADRRRQAGRATERVSSPLPAPSPTSPAAEEEATPAAAAQAAANAAHDEPAPTEPGAARRKPQPAQSGERKPVARPTAHRVPDAAAAHTSALQVDADAGLEVDAHPHAAAASAASPKGKPVATAAEDAAVSMPWQPAPMTPATVAAAHASSAARGARPPVAMAAGRATAAADVEARTAQAPLPGNPDLASTRPAGDEGAFAAVGTRLGAATEALPPVGASLDGSPPTTQAPAAAAPPAAAIAEATVTARPGSSAFAPQLGAQITTFVRDGVEHARLHLHPADMGPVSVQIQIDGAQAQVHLAAEHPLTRQALEQAMPLLAGSLREAGLTLSGGGVFEQARQGADPAAQDPSSRGRREAGTADDRAASAETRPLATPMPRRRGVVDLVA